MAFSRYARTRTATTPDGKRLQVSSYACRIIYIGCARGIYQFQTFTLAEGSRLDTVAADYYGDAYYWWVIAAASGIGWGCQVPPGTLIRVPVSLERIAEDIG